jgi:hypothetical protein
MRHALLDTALWITEQSLRVSPIEEEAWVRRQRGVVDSATASGQPPLREALVALLDDSKPEVSDRALLACKTLGRFAEIFGGNESRTALQRCIRAIPTDAARIPAQDYDFLIGRGIAAFRALLLDPSAPVSAALDLLPHSNSVFSDRAIQTLIELTVGASESKRREVTVPVLRWWKGATGESRSDEERRSLLALKVLSQLDDSVLVPVFLDELTSLSKSKKSNGVHIRLCQAGLKRNAAHISGNNIGALRELMLSEAPALREIGAEVYALVAKRLPGNLDCCRSILGGHHGTISPDLATAAVGALMVAGRGDDCSFLRNIYLSPMFPRHVRAAAQRGLQELGE